MEIVSEQRHEKERVTVVSVIPDLHLYTMLTHKPQIFNSIVSHLEKVNKVYFTQVYLQLTLS